MHAVLEAVFDRDSFLEIHPYYARNAIVGFARLDGWCVGVVANQPAHLAGALDIDSSDKIARHVRICDAFNIPVVTFVDTPGYLPGVDQEHYGVIRHGAKVIYAYCEATVPKISGRDPQGHGRRVPRHELEADAQRPGLRLAHRADRGDGCRTARCACCAGGSSPGAEDAAALEKRFVEEYREAFMNPYRAADVGQIDEVIEPRETRPRLVRALEVLRTKVQQNPPRKHGLMPV